MPFRFVSVAVLMWSLTGCGDGQPRLVPVQGQLTLDGKPLPHKSVRFIPEEGTKGNGAGCVADADGNYKLIAVRPGAVRDFPGAVAGKYRVVISEPLFPPDDAGKKPKDDGPEPAVAPADPRKRVVPAVYSDADKTPLKVEVPAEGGTVDLPLKSRP